MRYVTKVENDRIVNSRFIFFTEDTFYKYDEVELIRNSYLLCYSGDKESLINEDLDLVINESDQTIIPITQHAVGYVRALFDNCCTL